MHAHVMWSKHYSYFHVKIQIYKKLIFSELDVEDIARFCFCNLLSLHGSKSNVLPCNMYICMVNI